MNPQVINSIVNDVDTFADKPWYQSTTGPGLSMTLKSITFLMLPIFDQITGLTIVNQTVNNWIDALLIAIFGVTALVGYMRQKKALIGAIKVLGAKNDRLNDTLEKAAGIKHQGTDSAN